MDDSKYGYGLAAVVCVLLISAFIKSDISLTSVLPFTNPPFHDDVKVYCAKYHKSPEYKKISDTFFCVDNNGDYHEVDRIYVNTLLKKD